MKTILFALVLVPAATLAAAVYNCPKHGGRESWQVERRGLTYVCKACEEDKAKKAREDQAAAKADRVARGELLESDLRGLLDVTINTRSFGGTNLFERRCLPAIREKYVMVDGAPRLRADFEMVFKIVQSLGGGIYLAQKGLVFYRVDTTTETLADDALVTVLGGFTGELFDYTTVLGARKRIRVFATLARQGHAVAEVTLADAIAHLNGGGTFRVLFRYDPGPEWMRSAGDARQRMIAARGWQSGELPGIHATITQQGGAVVHLKQKPDPAL